MPRTATMDANGQVIRALREARGYSQTELAAAAGLRSHSHISAIETREKPPSARVLRRIAAALEVDVEVITARRCLCTQVEGIVA